MILQSTILLSSLSSTLSYSSSIQPKLSKFALIKTVHFHNNKNHLPIIKCSISQIHSYGTMDYEKRPLVKWNAIYRNISLMENPDLGSASVLNKWENEGKKFTKWELCRVVKELRKYRRYKLALEVYEWMNNREKRFRLSTSDAAIQLDLIAKVRGISTAEVYFTQLPDHLRDKRIYGALLNSYVHAKMKEKAESLLDKMRSKGYALHPLPFNVIMTLYMNLKEYDKVDSMVAEMMEKKIQLDLYSYNIWLSSSGSQGSTKKMEQVFEQMKLDRTINPNWTTFSTMAAMYTKQGQFQKAEECLKMVESRTTGRDRIPYHYLISLYGGVGNKEEVYRVWNTYKSVFPTIPNLAYHAMVSSLVRNGDIEEAEDIYEQWLSVKSNYDPRIGNLLMGWYVKQGIIEKAESFLDHMVEVGGKPNCTSWEILAEGHIGEKRIPEALSCLKEAFSAEGSKSWRPKPTIVSDFIKLCEQEADAESREVLMKLLKKMGFLENKTYASLIGLNGTVSGNELLMEENKIHENDDNDEGVSDEMLLNQLQGSL